ncbi:MAG: signal peptidase I [Clostridiaceae bacterium]|jgi:signal peptidase I|nr:signal peptidase I [Clostridiaceae bacterium]
MSAKTVLKEIWEWIVVFGTAFLIVSVLNTAVFATTQVRQTSMQNTLTEGQHLFVEKLSFAFGDPSKGDIIVFLEDKYPENYFDRVRVYLTDVSEIFKPVWSKTNVRLVKRVIATAGDEVDIRDGKVYINGKELMEPYVRGETYQREQSFPIKLKDGEFFVLGDNREVSKDSRTFGTIDRRQIEGKAVFRFWPLDKFGKLK